MDDISTPRPNAGRYKVLNILFLALVAFAVIYIFWRGFAAESSERPQPLFGQVTQLEWQDQQRQFKLVGYADCNRLQPGELVMREADTDPVVWKVAARDAHHLCLKRQHAGQKETENVPLPIATGASRLILLRLVA